MSPNRLRLGAVSYLNARPLVYGLERKPRFDLRYDVPSECARLLHDGAIDVGLIPSIEYLRGPQPYVLVPGPFWLVVIPAVQVAVAAAALNVALTLVVEVVVFAAEAWQKPPPPTA